MRVTIECHGVFRSLCGAEYTVEIDNGNATVGDALTALADAVPETADHLPRTACAAGDTLVDRDTMVEDGDRLALIPPVSGGQK